MRRIASSSHCSLPSQGITVGMLVDWWAGLEGTLSSTQPKLLSPPCHGGPGSSSLLLPHSPVQEWKSDTLTPKSGSWGDLQQHLFGFVWKCNDFREGSVLYRIAISWVFLCKLGCPFSKPAYRWLHGLYAKGQLKALRELEGVTKSYSSSFH